MDYPSGLITVHDDVDINGLTPDQCTTVQELIEPGNTHAVDHPEGSGSVHSIDATGSPTTSLSDGPIDEDYETDPFGDNIDNAPPLRDPNCDSFMADGSHYSGIPYFVPQNRNSLDVGAKMRDSLTTPSPLPGNMSYNTLGINQHGTTSGVQAQSRPNLPLQSDYQPPTPQISGHLRGPYLQQGSMDQATLLQPTNNQRRNNPLQPPMLPSQNATQWHNRGNYNGFPWGPSVRPNAQIGYQSFPTAGRDHYSLPRKRTTSMRAQLPTPPGPPFQDFEDRVPLPSDPMPQATFYNPKNKYIESNDLVEYRGTLLTKRETCLIVAMDRYLHLDPSTITEILKYHRHDYETQINLTGFVDWALAYPSDKHLPTSRTERDYKAARRLEASKPITMMIVDCLNAAGGFWARQAAMADQMWRRGMSEMMRRLRAQGDMDNSGNIVEEQPLHATFQQQQQQQQQDIPSQDRGRTMLQTPNQTRHPSVHHASTPKQPIPVRESPTTAAKSGKRGGGQKRQKIQTPSSAARRIAPSASASATKERTKTGARVAKKPHSRTTSKETVGQQRRSGSKDENRAFAGPHSRSLYKDTMNHSTQEPIIDPALLGHALESAIQEEEEGGGGDADGEGQAEATHQAPTPATMMGTPMLATDVFAPNQATGGGAEEAAGVGLNFDDWMEPDVEVSEGNGGDSDSEYVP